MTASEIRLALCLTVALAPAVATAQTPPIKPGLWEVRSDRKLDGQAAPADAMKNLPPDVRLRGRHGGTGAGGLPAGDAPQKIIADPAAAAGGPG